MVNAQLVVTIMAGMLSGFLAGYIVKLGDEIKDIYRKLGVPKNMLMFMEVFTTLAILLIYWIILILLID